MISGGVSHSGVATFVLVNACVPLADPAFGIVNYLTTTD